jgi:hypothetical protein
MNNNGTGRSRPGRFYGWAMAGVVLVAAVIALAIGTDDDRSTVTAPSSEAGRSATAPTPPVNDPAQPR